MSFYTGGSSYTLDVAIQDQTTKPIIQNFYQRIAETTLATATVIDGKTIAVADATNIVANQYGILFSSVINKVMFFNILSIDGTIITIDTLIDAVYPIGSHISVGNKQIIGDGSVTPIIYSVRSTAQQTNLSFDVTRIMFTAKTTSTCDLSTFGDIESGLTNGLILRKVDGETSNIFNVKTNGNFMNIMYDFDILTATNPAQGQNGFKGRMTFAGQEKMGVAIRLAPGEDLQLIVQDDLSDLLGFIVLAEGHIVEY